MESNDALTLSDELRKKEIRELYNGKELIRVNLDQLARYRFSDYVNKVRIERAKELLKKVDYKIYDIAEEVGYKNSKYFIKIFKKYEKISPNEYKLKNIERK